MLNYDSGYETSKRTFASLCTKPKAQATPVVSPKLGGIGRKEVNKKVVGKVPTGSLEDWLPARFWAGPALSLHSICRVEAGRLNASHLH